MSNRLSQSEFDRRMVVAQRFATNIDFTVCRYCGLDCECVVDPDLPTDDELIAGGARNDTMVDIICQRNELLDALKLLIEDPRFQVSIGGNPNAVDKAYAQCSRAIAHAESK